MSNILNNYIGLGKETTYGVAVAPSVFLSILESDGIQINKNIQYIEALQSGVFAKNRYAYVGQVEYSGGFEMPILPEGVGYILLSALGGISSNNETGETVVFRHVFSEAENKPSFTLEQKIGEILKRFAGFIATGFKVEVNSGEFVRFSFEGLAKTQVDATTSTPAYESARPFNFADVVSLKIGGTDFKDVIETFSVEYANEVGKLYGLGSVEPQGAKVGRSEVKGSISLILDNNTKALFDSYINAETNSIELLIKGDAIGSASNYEFKLTIPKAVFEKAESKFTTDYNKVDIDFNGIFDEATSSLLTVELVNLKSGY